MKKEASSSKEDLKDIQYRKEKKLHAYYHPDSKKSKLDKDFSDQLEKNSVKLKKTKKTKKKSKKSKKRKETKKNLKSLSKEKE